MGVNAPRVTLGNAVADAASRAGAISYGIANPRRPGRHSTSAVLRMSRCVMGVRRAKRQSSAIGHFADHVTGRTSALPVTTPMRWSPPAGRVCRRAWTVPVTGVISGIPTPLQPSQLNGAMFTKTIEANVVFGP